MTCNKLAERLAIMGIKSNYNQKIIYKSIKYIHTNDDWLPSYSNEPISQELSSKFKFLISFFQRFSNNSKNFGGFVQTILLEYENNNYKIIAKGADDFGLSKTFTTNHLAYFCWDRLATFMNIIDFKKLGFKKW